MKKKATVKAKEKATKPSLAGTNRPYAIGELVLKVGAKALPLGEAQVRLRNDGDGGYYAHIQIANSNVPLKDRNYGAVLDVPGLKKKSHFALAVAKDARQ